MPVMSGKSETTLLRGLTLFCLIALGAIHAQTCDISKFNPGTSTTDIQGVLKSNAGFFYVTAESKPTSPSDSLVLRVSALPKRDLYHVTQVNHPINGSCKTVDSGVFVFYPDRQDLVQDALGLPTTTRLYFLAGNKTSGYLVYREQETPDHKKSGFFRLMSLYPDRQVDTALAKKAMSAICTGNPDPLTFFNKVAVNPANRGQCPRQGRAL